MKCRVAIVKSSPRTTRVFWLRIHITAYEYVSKKKKGGKEHSRLFSRQPKNVEERALLCLLSSASQTCEAKTEERQRGWLRYCRSSEHAARVVATQTHRRTGGRVGGRGP